MKRVLLGVLLISSAPLIGTQASPQSRLDAERSALITAYSKPWHRIIRFTLFQKNKKKEISGTVEDIVYSPFNQQRTYISTKESFSTYTLPQGTFTDHKKAFLPGILRLALQGMTSQLVPQLSMKDHFLAIGAPTGSNFSCYQVERSDASGFIALSARSSPSFCFDHDGPLRTVTLEHVVTAVNAQILFNQRRVPSRILLTTEGGPLASLETILLEPLPENGKIQKPSEAIYAGERSEISPCDSGGMPAMIRTASTFGPTNTRGVLLDVHVNERGKVDRASVIASAVYTLEDEAQDDVRKETYIPCVIDGKATDQGLMTLWWGKDNLRFRKAPSFPF